MVPSIADEPLTSELTHVQPSSLLHANEAWLRQLEMAATPQTPLSGVVPEQQLRGDATAASILRDPSSSLTAVPGIADTRPPADSIPIADVMLSRSDAHPSQYLQVPESDEPVVDVLLFNCLNFLYILNPSYCRCLRPGLNHRDTFSLPKCLLLASGDFSTMAVFTFVPIFPARSWTLIVQPLRPRSIPRLWRSF